MAFEILQYNDIEEEKTEKKRKKCNNGVFHVFHVNRSVNIFLLNRKIFYVTKIC